MKKKKKKHVLILGWSSNGNIQESTKKKYKKTITVVPYRGLVTYRSHSPSLPPCMNDLVLNVHKHLYFLRMRIQTIHIYIHNSFFPLNITSTRQKLSDPFKTILWKQLLHQNEYSSKNFLFEDLQHFSPTLNYLLSFSIKCMFYWTMLIHLHHQRL